LIRGFGVDAGLLLELREERRQEGLEVGGGGDAQGGCGLRGLLCRGDDAGQSEQDQREEESFQTSLRG
jgi:hypothetical protein